MMQIRGSSLFGFSNRGAMHSIKQRILIIDDSPKIHEDFRKILSTQNNSDFDQAKESLFGNLQDEKLDFPVEIESAYQGKEGLELVKHAISIGSPFALAFVDIRMPPSWDGVETIKRIWEVDPDIQIIICSAYSDYSWAEINKQLKHSDNFLILKKPFDVIEVRQASLALIKKWILKKQVLDQVQRLEKISLGKSKFFATMSHEIRIPMNGILGALELIPIENLTEEQKFYLQICSDSSNSLMKIINQILDYAKIESGKFELEKIQFDLKEEIKSIIKLFLPTAITKDVELVLKLSSKLPDFVIGDPFRLRQIISNLINNAIKFSAENNKITVKAILLNKANDDCKIKIIVKDKGIGISPEKVKLIFEPFSQVDSSIIRTYGGTGLGLSIVKQLVEKMNGTVKISSVLGKGTIFTIKLPYVVAHEQLVKTETAKKNKIKLQVANHEKILLVEDDKVNQQICHAMLKKLGCNADVVGNGKKAIQLWEKNKYPLILMDCHLPEIDGFQTTSIIRQLENGNDDNHKTIIIALTADVLKETQERCLESGMDDYLSKPFNIEKLSKIIIKWQINQKLEPNVR